MPKIAELADYVLRLVADELEVTKEQILSKSRKACQFAISKMKRMNPATGKKEPVDIQSKEAIEEIFSKNGIKLEHNEGYDFVYLWHMAKADYYKSSLPDEKSLALFVRDTIEDPDMLGSNCFRRWLADADATGLVIEWYDLL